MVKMTFVRTIKYKGVIHPANSPVNVQDKDVAELKRIGGFIIAEDAVEAEAKAEAEAVESKESAAEEKTLTRKKNASYEKRKKDK